MGHFFSGRSFCAFVAATSAAMFSSTSSAAFLTVYGGPTYSQTSGGYLPTVSQLNRPLSPILPAISVTRFGDVNDAGVAVANFNQISVPLSTTQVDVRLVAVGWSAVASPVELAGTNSAQATQVQAIDNTGKFVGMQVAGLSFKRSASGNSVSTVGTTTDSAQWTAPSAPQLFDSLGSGPTSGNLAYAINGQGVAVGTASKPSFGTRAVRWNTTTGQATELGTLSGNANDMNLAFAFAVNSSGTAVGQAGPNTVGQEPVRWDAGGTSATQLGHLGTVPAGFGSLGLATAINDAGIAVGYVGVFDLSGNSKGTRAVRWDAGGTTATELGNLGTDANGVTAANAIAVNSAGTIIGNVYKSGSSLSQRGVRWEAGSTTPIELRPLPGPGFPVNTLASDINSQGIVVGSYFGSPASSTFTFGSGLAVYWTPDGTPVDLNSLIDPASGWILRAATAISDTGWTMGIGSFDPDGAGSQAAYDRTFLLQVPEPSGMLLGVFSAVAALALRRYVRST